ncbi:MAG: zinc ribbon domain-containing protein [bacterium]|nr:zinc ribbon domain-containing protein [bacterium]
MPIYEYACNACGEHFETLVLGKDKSIECPRCRGVDVTRRLSSFASQGTEKGGGGSCGSCSASSCSSCG